MAIAKVKKVKKNYIDNKQFYNAILEHWKKVELYRQEGKPDPKISNYIGECIWKIAEHLSYHPWFIGYSFRDEMISDGIENCIKYFDRFNPTKYNNPFAYFTQIIYFAFRRRIQSEEKQRYILYKNFEKAGHILDEETGLISPETYDNILEFIEKFEKKELEKKSKKKLKKEMKDAEKENQSGEPSISIEEID